MYKSIIKPLAFTLKAESAHKWVTKTFEIGSAIPGIKQLLRSSFSYRSPNLERTLWGLNFKNPVGLAAGFDKDGKHYEAMSLLGFGFIEIGTVTPKPQIGNPKPRLFRLPEDESLINRMGFNNDGVDAMVSRLKNRKKSDLIIGGNIGKNKTTPNEEAVNDYLICFKKLHAYVDYFVVNVSSPNTPNLRALQDRGPLTNILHQLQEANKTYKELKPILLKIAPDLNTSQLDDIIEIISETGTQGIIATNTTIARSPLQSTESKIREIGAGGLSGKAVQDRSTEVIRYIAEKSGGSFPIIGVGGINSPQSAQEKIDAGASLVQVYSGLVYEGPSLIKQILRKIHL